MAEVKWIKIATDIFTDEKILLIESMPDADSILIIWFKLLAFAGQQNNDGIFRMNGTEIAYTDEMLASIFRRPLNTVRLAIETFKGFGMIQEIEKTLVIPNWEKHQNVDGLDKVREQTKNRVARYRERQKEKLLGSGNATSNVTVTHGNGTDKDKEIDKDISSSSLRGDGKLINRLTEEESDCLFKVYQDADYLIDEVQAEVDKKKRKVEKPFQYIVGYAEKKGWPENEQD